MVGSKEYIVIGEKPSVQTTVNPLKSLFGGHKIAVPQKHFLGAPQLFFLIWRTVAFLARHKLILPPPSDDGS